MSVLTLTMTLLTAFVLIAPLGMVFVLVTGGAAALRTAPATAAPLGTPASACGCGDSGCGTPAAAHAAHAA